MKHKNLLQLAMTLLLAMVSTGAWAQWKWVGSDGNPKVEMGIDEAYDEYASWYTFTDDGGESEVVWAIAPDEDGEGEVDQEDIDTTVKLIME